MNIQIKKAKIEDVKKLQEFMLLLMKYEWSFDKTTDLKWAKGRDCKKYFEDRVKKQNSIAFLAMYGEEIVGYLSGEVEKGI